MLSVEEAQSELISTHTCAVEAERVSTKVALERIAATDIRSSMDVPPQDNSAMDGYAVRSTEIQTKGVCMTVSQRIVAGAQPEPLEVGTIARIFTGGVIPEGADAVVIQENVELHEDKKSITILSDVREGDNIRGKGQDIHRNDNIVGKGTKLSPAHLALIASVGVSQVMVFKRLTVAVVSTGSELIEPGKPLEFGQIYNSNRTMLMALCQQLGYEVFDCGIVKDTLEATKLALAEASQHADVIISTGGVSVGEEDHVKPAVEELGQLAFWKVQMKPGKPVAFGNVRTIPFVGLPGNPVSSFVVFQLLAKILLSTLQGQKVKAAKVYPVIANFSKKEVSREEYLRVQLVNDEKGQINAEVYSNQSSGVMSSLVWADGFVRQRIGEEIERGSKVEFLALD